MEICINDLLRILKKGILFMIITALICGAVAYGVSTMFIKKTYETTIKLYVEADNKGNSSYNDLSSYNYAASLVKTYIEMLETNNFYQRVSESFDGEYTMKEIGSMVRFSNESETEVFKATVTADTPTEAKLIADRVSEIAPVIISELNDSANLKIVDKAILPTSPASPNVTRNTLFAFVIGFVGMFIYLLIKDLFDVKFKYNSDMTTYNDIPILAAIPDFDSDKFSPAYYFSKETQPENSSREV